MHYTMDYWSSYSDLYADCNEVDIQKIEAATKDRRLGRFALARNELAALRSPSQKFLPVLLLEKATLEADCGLEGNRAELLGGALNTDIQSVAATSESLLSLLRLNHANATLKLRGSLKSTLDVARKQKAHLENIPLELWNSVNVCKVMVRTIYDLTGCKDRLCYLLLFDYQASLYLFDLGKYRRGSILTRCPWQSFYRRAARTSDIYWTPSASL